MEMTKQQRITLFIICIAVLIIQIDTSVVNIAIKEIGEGLDSSIAKLQWVIDGYNLIYASFMITGAKLGDLYGRQRIFVFGGLLFVFGSLACGLANTIDVLITGRVVAGFGAALMLPVSLAIIAVTFLDSKARAKAIGIWASCNGIAFIIGPTLGGWLLNVGGWRLIFMMVVPFCFISIIGALLQITNTRNEYQQKIDLVGQVLVVMFLASLTIISIDGANWGWLSIKSVLAYVIIMVSLISLLFVENNKANAIIPLALFKHKVLSASLLIAGLMTFGMYALLFILPIYFMGVLEINALNTGLAFLPMSLSFVIVSQKSGSLIERFKYRPVMFMGMLLMSLGTFFMAVLLTHDSFWLIEIALLMIGIGLGLNTGPVVAIALQCVSQNYSGTVSGLTNTARMIGATLGVAVIGSVFSNYNQSIQLLEQAIIGFRIAFFIASIFLLIGAVLVYLLISNTPKKLEDL